VPPGPAVGRPRGTSHSGAGAWMCEAPSQDRQTYFGRTVTSTRKRAGMTSRRSLRSSPTLTISPQPHGHSVLSGSMICSTRSRCGGRWPLFLPDERAFFLRSPRAFSVSLLASASLPSATSTSSKGRCCWLGWAFSDDAPNLSRRSCASMRSRRIRACWDVARRRSASIRAVSATASWRSRSATLAALVIPLDVMAAV